jgi:cobalt-zinc-cadmium efflux system membrane fusion protein
MSSPTLNRVSAIAGNKARVLGLSLLALLLAAGLGAAATWFFVGRSAGATAPAPPPVEKAATPVAQLEAAAPGGAASLGVVEVPVGEQEAMKLAVEPVQAAPFADSLWVTGKIALNQDRVAHIYPLVEGRVESVHVRFGQEVKAGDALAIIQSKEVGQAKLNLFTDRLARDFAAHRNERHALIAANVHDLVAALRAGTDIDAIEETFHGRPMGAYREQLISAYAALLKARLDYARLEVLAEKGVAEGRRLTAAKAARDAARAAFQAWLDQAGHTSEMEAIRMKQMLREAETRVAVDETSLKILGYSDEELQSIDPKTQGEMLAHYPVRAPFDGTVIAKDVVLMEQATPARQLFQVADMSTVWIEADIFEKHLPRLRELRNQKIRFRANAYPGEEFTAQVFYTGEIVDAQTRTVPMTAVTANPRRLLKPGMFVEVELRAKSDQPVAQVPLSAVLDHEGKTFVFVRETPERFVAREVQLGRRNEKTAEVLDGLQSGDAVVVHGGFALKSRMLASLMEE